MIPGRAYCTHKPVVIIQSSYLNSRPKLLENTGHNTLSLLSITMNIGTIIKCDPRFYCQ
jgi:hypothetical protein